MLLNYNFFAWLLTTAGFAGAVLLVHWALDKNGGSLFEAVTTVFSKGLGTLFASSSGGFLIGITAGSVLFFLFYEFVLPHL